MIARAAIKPRKQGRTNSASWALNIPVQLVRAHPQIVECMYAAELTAEGILYRPLGRLVLTPTNWPSADAPES